MAKQKLTIAMDNFQGAMKRRLRNKQRQGFSGWDSPIWNSWNIPQRIQNKVTNVLEKGPQCEIKDLVDIANFAMFLYNKHPAIQGELNKEEGDEHSIHK